MPFCSFSSEYVMDGQTMVDNAFITEFLPDAPKAAAAVYLYGLYLAGNIQTEDNSLEVMARVLNLTHDDIMDCYIYLEGFGLVNIIHKKPLEVKYVSMRGARMPLKKIKPGKYKDFNTQIQSQLSGRMIEPNEYHEYYLFLEQTHTEPEALVMIAKYCADLKGDNVGHHYILTVARNLAAAGCKTVETVEEKLAHHAGANPAIEAVLKALGTRRALDYEDRALYQKWTADYGFPAEVILKAAKGAKNKGGLKKLDTQLTEYYKFGLLSAKEIEEFQAAREQNYALAKGVNRVLGVYYESLDYIVETYISVWKGYGFSDDTLLEVAKYCFKQNIRQLEGMNTVVEKFRRLGLVTREAIAQHIEQLGKYDGTIKQILEAAGLLRAVTQSDRAAYKTWSGEWDMPDEVILHAAALSRAANNPMQFLNRILSNYKQKNIRGLAAAQADVRPAPAAAAGGAPPAHNYPQYEYTKEQLNALFDDIDNIKL